jgi:hypothetical protein
MMALVASVLSCGFFFGQVSRGNRLSAGAFAGLLFLVRIPRATRSSLREQSVAQQGLPFRVVAKRIHAIEDGVFKGAIVLVRKGIGIVVALAKGHLRILEYLGEAGVIAKI